MKEFNIKRYSCVNIGSLQLPICISIENIMDSDELSFEYSDDKIMFYNENGIMQVAKDNTTDFFYGKFKKQLSDIKMIEFIYKYIDFYNIKKLKLEFMYFSFDEFYDYCMESYDVNYESLYLASNEILYHIQQIKTEFSQPKYGDNDHNDKQLLHVFPCTTCTCCNMCVAFKSSS